MGYIPVAFCERGCACAQLAETPSSNTPDPCASASFALIAAVRMLVPLCQCCCNRSAGFTVWHEVGSVSVERLCVDVT